MTLNTCKRTYTPRSKTVAMSLVTPQENLPAHVVPMPLTVSGAAHAWVRTLSASQVQELAGHLLAQAWDMAALVPKADKP